MNEPVRELALDELLRLPLYKLVDEKQREGEVPLISIEADEGEVLVAALDGREKAEQN